ncbi:hypothetical protein M5E88_07240 [Akkermansia muciniphila]|nr:hypothetical protein M5E88_07240 [Akkermansia muciniphila]
MGLGDFARQCSRGGADGYDYSGGGYSVGADSGFGHDNGIWGSPSASSTGMPKAGASRAGTRRTPGWAPCTGAVCWKKAGAPAGPSREASRGRRRTTK